ncbi:MFS transporter [Leucobacter sp. UCMA 4100]|uniref:MFS transporter n=1 Tax=Leucobacter sp. UCMA 4100 TaxID=2810534 RepID=UPI0022EB78C3|nr:MFS transporter [Leucobacter sp. UCMA 4100]MDA3145967.1 MFS transporter [Leucobacter sp. UCMA 4100]
MTHGTETMQAHITQGMRKARVALFIVFFAQGLGFGSLFARLPSIKERFDLSDTTLAILTLALPLLAGVATLVTGTVVQRLHSDIVLRIAIIAEFAALVIIGFADSFAMLIPAWVLMGVAFGTVDATMNMKGVALQTKYRRSIMVGFYAIYSAAGIVASLAAAGAAAAGLPLWVFFGVEALVLLPLLLMTGSSLVNTRIVAERRTESGENALAVKVPWLPVISIGVVLTSAYFIESSASSWGSVYVHDTLNSPESVAALAFGGYSAAMLIGRLSADWLIRSFGVKRVIQVCALVAFGGMVLVVIAPAAPVALIGFALAGGGLCVIAPLAFAAAGSLDTSGVAVARANSFTYVGFLLGAAIIGPVADMSSMRIAYLISVVLALVVVLSANNIARRIAPITD